MSQVSRRRIKDITQKRIESLFVSSIILTNSKDEAISLVEDLLTPTEKVMLSKRLSIAYLLIEGYDYDTISEILKVSKSTIGSVSLLLKIKGNGLRKVIKKLKKDDEMQKILLAIYESIEEFLATMPGRDWKSSRREMWRRRRSQEKPF